jgi:hypothetical protein
VRVAVLKGLAAFVALLSVGACQSSELATDRNPSVSPSAPASSSSAPIRVLTYPNNPMRAAVIKSRFVATHVIDDGALTIQPPPPGQPAMSKRAAMNRFWAMGLGPFSGPTLAVYGSVTLVPRRLTLVRMTEKPAWVIVYRGPSLPCPYHKTRRAPLSLRIAIVPTDGSRGVEFTSAGRGLCGWWTPTRATWA